MRATDSLSNDLISALPDRALLRTQSHIGGRWVATGDGAIFAVADPANGDTLGQLEAEFVAHCADAPEALIAREGADTRSAPRSRRHCSRKG